METLRDPMRQATKADFLLLDAETFAWLTGMTFRGLTVSQGPNGYRVILRAFTRELEAVYAMTEGDDMRQAAHRLLDALSKRGGESLWRHDRFFKNG